MNTESVPVHSHAPANRELVAAFGRYMEARGFAAGTQKEYGDAASRYVESLRAASAVEATRADVRLFLNELCERGLSATSISKYTFGLRAFYKFLRLAGIAPGASPMVTISNRRIPRRVPRVLTLEEIERLIAATQSPFERAVIEVLYSTGVRVSELVSLKLEDVDMGEHVILVKKGKGRKDRYVLFGRQAAKAIADYLRWRPSKEFLFEAPARNGRVYKIGGNWYARFYMDRQYRNIAIFRTSVVGRQSDAPLAGPMPTWAQARREFERIASKIPGFEPVPQRPYHARSIDLLLNRVGNRARLGRVHPHMLRRAMACHMLQGGANLRVVQDLLGHERIMTTQLYTYLSPNDLKKVHERCHPHERGE
jgi:site-specific recombinase XerD